MFSGFLINQIFQERLSCQGDLRYFHYYGFYFAFCILYS